MKKVILLFVLLLNFSLSAVADDDVSFVSYEQGAVDFNGAMSLKNNTEQDIEKVKFQLTYYDMQGNPIDREIYSQNVTIYPGFVKKFDIPAYERERNYHYYKTDGWSNYPAFKVEYKLISYETADSKVIVDEALAEESGNDSSFFSALGGGLALISLPLIPLMILGAAIGLFVLVAQIARKRHRNVVGWLLLSIFFSPILAIIILLIIGDDRPRY